MKKENKSLNLSLKESRDSVSKVLEKLNALPLFVVFGTYKKEKEALGLGYFHPEYSLTFKSQIIAIMKDWISGQENNKFTILMNDYPTNSGTGDVNFEKFN